MKSVLCIEDSLEIQILVEAALNQYQVTRVSTLGAAREWLGRRSFDLIVLDLELPDGDGRKLLVELQSDEGTSGLPVFILTGDTQTASKVIAFSLGADDFITKPFDPMELRARVEAKLRKIEAFREAQNVVRVADLTLDVQKQRIAIASTQGPQEVDLTSIEFKLLLALAKSPERVFSRARLLDLVWGPGVNITDRTVDSHVGHLRKKLLKSRVQIDTVLNEGYRLILPGRENC